MHRKVAVHNCVAMSAFPPPVTRTMQIKSIGTKVGKAMFSLKNLYPGGIRTRIFCSSGECDDHCATSLEAGS
jgi:hypothetical protein